MGTPEATADRETSTVYCRITKNKVARTQEVIDGRVLVDWDADGEIVGVEIIDANIPDGDHWIVTRGLKTGNGNDANE